MGESNNGLLEDFYDIRDANDYTGQKQNEGWLVYRSTVDYYDETFKGLGRRVISSFLKERKDRGEPVFAIDVASEGTAIRGLRRQGLINGGLSVGITDPRKPETISEDESNNVKVLAGDLLKGLTWKRIRQELSRMSGDKGADLVMCHPVSGFDNIPEQIQGVFIQKEIELLRPGGMLVSQTKYGISEENLRGYITKGMKGMTNVEPDLLYEPDYACFRVKLLQG